MGQILSSLNLRGNDTLVPEISFDIENATPSSEETTNYKELYTLLVEPNSNLLKTLQQLQLQPATDEIREAIATPDDELVEKALKAIVPTVDALRKIYSYSSELEQGIPKLLDLLCKDGDAAKDLDRHPGLTKLFAKILDFVFEFDYLKIRNFSLQNEYSYYRRALQTGKTGKPGSSPLNEQSDLRAALNEDGLSSAPSPIQEQSDLRAASNEDDLSNRISLFIASSTPMLKCVIDTTTKHAESKQLAKYISEWLASIWAACYHTLDTSSKKSNNGLVVVDTFCLKVMVVSIILYDHIDPNGAFAKHSPIDITASLKIIQNVNQVNLQEQSSTSSLFSALRYNTKHFNDESTPKRIKNSVMAITKGPSLL